MQIRKLGLMIGCAAISAQNYAQEPGSIDLGGFQLIPMLDVTLAHDDNVTRASADQIDSWVSIIAPQAQLVNNFGANQVSLGYRLSRGTYFSSSEDDYTDHFLSANLDYELNARNSVNVSALFEDGHDARGTGYSIGNGNLITSPDLYKQSEFDFVYNYGALTADGRLELNYNFRNLNYDENTDLFRARDRDLQRVGAIFYYRVGASTDLLLDVNHTQISYDFIPDGATTLDSTKTRYLVGLKWESTAATSGYAKVGYQQKKFDAADREDFSGVDWQVGVIWQPVDYSRFEFSTNSDTNETNGEGNFIKSRDYTAQWNHQWLDRLSSTVSATAGTDEYRGTADVRKDDLTRLKVAADYQFRRWVSFQIAYEYEQRDSNREIIDYDRNVFSIRAIVTL